MKEPIIARTMNFQIGRTPVEVRFATNCLREYTAESQRENLENLQKCAGKIAYNHMRNQTG